MFSVLYFEVYESSASSYNFLYYLLNYSANHLTVVENEKNYGEKYGLTEREVISEIVDLLNSLGGNVGNLTIVTDAVYKQLAQHFVNEAKAYLYISRGMPFVVKNIAEEFGQKDLSLFDLYTSRFGVSDLCKIDMINNLLVDLAMSKDRSNTAIIFIKTVRKADFLVITAAWGVLGVNHSVTQLGYNNICLDLHTDNYLEVNKFMRSLKKDIAISGLSFDSLIPIFYSGSNAIEFNNLVRKYGIKPIENSISFTDLLMSVSHRNLWMRESNLQSNEIFMRLFSGVLRLKYIVTAKELIQVFDNLSQKLSFVLSYDRRSFQHSGIYYKDFSSDIILRDFKNGYSYAVIMDCEGTSYGGCKEVGGLIIAYGGGNLAKIETFYFKQRDFSEGISNVVSRYEQITGRYLPTRGIPVITYGGSDKNMILGELKETSSRLARRRFKSQFEFIDSQGYIFEYLDGIGLVSGERHLSDIAENLGVEVIVPKHNALNDAKTLFNVLSRIYMFRDGFVI